MNIPLRVKNLIKRCDSTDPLAIAKTLKATVLYCDTPRGIHGLWRRILRRKYICVNVELTEDWQIKAVIAHEIAHILLHRGYKCYCIAGRTYVANQRYENEADEFATELISYSYDIEKWYILDFLQNGWRFKQ